MRLLIALHTHHSCLVILRTSLIPKLDRRGAISTRVSSASWQSSIVQNSSVKIHVIRIWVCSYDEQLNSLLLLSFCALFGGTIRLSKYSRNPAAPVSRDCRNKQYSEVSVRSRGNTMWITRERKTGRLRPCLVPLSLCGYHESDTTSFHEAPQPIYLYMDVLMMKQPDCRWSTVGPLLLRPSLQGQGSAAHAVSSSHLRHALR